MKMTKLTKKELEYLINLCSGQLDKAHIDLDDVRDRIAKDFRNDECILDIDKIGWGYAYIEFVQFLIDELEESELNDLVSSQGNTEVFIGVRFKDKTLDLSGYLSDFLLSYAILDNCTINIDTEAVPRYFMRYANLNNCHITLQPKCTAIPDNAFDCSIKGNNDIILPKTIKYIGSINVDQTFYDTLTLKYQGTLKEFRKIKKSEEINCDVMCADGAKLFIGEE